MKKILTAIAIITMTIGALNAQVVDTNLYQAPQQTEAQKAEQERIEKEQAKLAKEQAKEQAKAEKEQARAEKEQAKAARMEKKAEAERAAAEKKARRQARMMEMGRNGRFFVDPYLGALATTRPMKLSDIANVSIGYDLGLNLTYSYPIAKKWDLNAGVGYRYTVYRYTNHIDYSNQSQQFVLDTTVIPSLNRRSQLASQYVVVPIHLSHVSKGETNWYLGIDLGYMLSNTFSILEVKDNQYNTTYSFNNIKASQWRADLTFGICAGKRHFLLQEGLSLYYNLLPTYTCEGNKYHEFGINLHL